MGKPAATDRLCLPSLSHSFTLDVVCAVQYQGDAERFSQALGQRLGKFGLALDVHFISSLPVRQGHAYRAWVDSKPVQRVWDGD